jgi:23S rRNA (adenine2503-C2)-methyltransferase
MTKQLIYDLSAEDLTNYLHANQQPAFRTKQLLEGLYGKLYSDFLQFANIPNPLKLKLSEDLEINPLTLSRELISEDRQTEKALFELVDGSKIESVLMHYEERNSLCISTQVGCPMDCVFCATGQMGFKRNLSSGEILGQVIYYMRKLREQGESLTNVVYMGMGEPFLNYDNLIASLQHLNNPDMLNFGARRVTISTVGIIPKIDKFTELDSQVNLAVSLHAPTDEVRNTIVPANRLYPIKPLIAACRRYTDRTHRRLTFEYALIDSVNDSLEQADQLAYLLKGLLCHVNLIALNPSNEYPMSGSDKSQVYAFHEQLLQHGIQTTVRLRRGLEINAGCGQLASDDNPQ